MKLFNWKKVSLNRNSVESFGYHNKKADFVSLGVGYNLDDRTTPLEIRLKNEYRKRHTWVYGTTGSGKTRLAEHLVTDDIISGESVVFLDPKGDEGIFNKITLAAAAADRLDDLILVSPIFPDDSIEFNPLEYYYMPEELVAHIVSGVAVGKEPFFFNVAYETSIKIVQAFLLLANHRNDFNGINFHDILKVVSHMDMQKLLDNVKSIADKETNKEAEMLYEDILKIVNSGQDYYNKVSSSLRVALNELCSGSIGQIIGRARGNKIMERLEKGKSVIVVVQLGSLITSRAAYTVGKVILSMIQAFVGRKYASAEKIQPALNVYIDEAHNCMYPAIETAFSQGGSANLRMCGFSQSISQIYNVLGSKDAGDAILSNLNTKIYMKLTDEQTSSHGEREFGTRKAFSTMLQVGSNPTVRQLDEPYVEAGEIEELKPGEFFMKSYDGRYHGRVHNVDPAIIEVMPKKAQSKYSADALSRLDDDVSDEGLNDDGEELISA